MRVYLAGPMTGLPQYNFPAFDRAASVLRGQGYDVVSPAELDDPEVRERVLGGRFDYNVNESWGTFLARDVKLIADGDIDAVVCLPGWEQSRGARLETFVAAGLDDKPVLSYPYLFTIPHHDLAQAWAGNH